MKSACLGFAIGVLICASLRPQQPSQSSGVPNASQLLEWAASGRCQEALPAFRTLDSAGTLDSRTRRGLGFARVRCAMALNAIAEATSAITALRQEFPDDPAVLYLSIRTFSDLSIRASQELLRKAPDSPEVHQLNAEALETQGKWKEAAEQYRSVLAKAPNTRGIHYRLGRLILSQPKTSTTMQDARREFEAELKLNPANVGSHFVLGEIARQEERLKEAIERFSQAAKLDPNFSDAFLSLGQSLLADGRPSEAIAPLERATVLQPDNPAAHFHLAAAYRRTGRKQDADRAMRAHADATEKARKSADRIQSGIRGETDRPDE